MIFDFEVLFIASSFILYLGLGPFWITTLQTKRCRLR